jgi:hypothetical protein
MYCNIKIWNIKNIIKLERKFRIWFQKRYRIQKKNINISLKIRSKVTGNVKCVVTVFQNLYLISATVRLEFLSSIGKVSHSYFGYGSLALIVFLQLTSN